MKPIKIIFVFVPLCVCLFLGLPFFFHFLDGGDGHLYLEDSNEVINPAGMNNDYSNYSAGTNSPVNWKGFNNMSWKSGTDGLNYPDLQDKWDGLGINNSINNSGYALFGAEKTPAVRNINKDMYNVEPTQRIYPSRTRPDEAGKWPLISNSMSVNQTLISGNLSTGNNDDAGLASVKDLYSLTKPVLGMLDDDNPRENGDHGVGTMPVPDGFWALVSLSVLYMVFVFFRRKLF